MSCTRLFLTAFLGLALQLGRAEAAVGYQHLMIDDPKGGAIEIGIWYPTDAKTASTYVGPYPLDVAVDAAPTGGRHPLVVMSHGNGGSFAGHVDTAMALAEAGFVHPSPIQARAIPLGKCGLGKGEMKGGRER